MLGYVTADGTGEADRLIAAAARALGSGGVRLAGAVQVNLDRGAAQRCAMDLHVLPGAQVVRISQDLGSLSQGCRLDPDGLERAAGLARAALDQGAELFIVNKFGKQEVEGRGFRPLINEALSCGIPVLVAVGAGHLAAFEAYAGGLGTALAPDLDSLLDWAKAQIPTAASA